jgi:sarcosine oxidase
MADRISRRFVLKASAAIAGSSFFSSFAVPCDVSMPRHAIVIGAGVFGGWTAIHLLRQGVKVTLLDAWGPGNSRASSGGETRVIRASYGPKRVYTQMAVRALQLWTENEVRWKRRILTRIGVLWFVIGSEDFELASIPLLQEAGLPAERLTTEEASHRYPQINFDGVKWVLWESQAGYLLARESCRLVVENFISEGGEYRQSVVNPGKIENQAMQFVELSDGSKLKADVFVFACGPWLGKIFPDVLGQFIQPTRQEVFFFGTPPGDDRFNETKLPVWANHGQALMYGIPGNQYRGFKVADDTHGPPFDPTSGERIISEQNLRVARDLMEFRFPALKGAPLLESRVCQYENSPDSNYIIDRHPEARNVWILGGGSGHGFKMGPAIGEYASGIILETKTADPFFRLARFQNE